MSEDIHDWYFLHHLSSRMGRYVGESERRFIRAALRSRGAGLSVADVGGGEGRYSVYTRQLGHHPVLLEYDDTPIELAVERGVPAPIVQSDGLAIPLLDATFDVVMAMGVGPCMTGKDDGNVKFFADAWRVLKPSGTLIFTASNRGSYAAKLRKLVRKGEPEYDQSYYFDNHTEYSRKLAEGGFRLDACWGYRWLPILHASNNPLIPMGAWLERALQLKRLPGASPWLFFTATKV
jgi:SAM-dependent methyltransferase